VTPNALQSQQHVSGMEIPAAARDDVRSGSPCILSPGEIWHTHSKGLITPGVNRLGAL